jgi:hypothetical protein
MCGKLKVDMTPASEWSCSDSATVSCIRNSYVTFDWTCPFGLLEALIHKQSKISAHNTDQLCALLLLAKATQLMPETHRRPAQRSLGVEPQAKRADMRVKCDASSTAAGMGDVSVACATSHGACLESACLRMDRSEEALMSVPACQSTDERGGSCSSTSLTPNGTESSTSWVNSTSSNRYRSKPIRMPSGGHKGYKTYMAEFVIECNDALCASLPLLSSSSWRDCRQTQTASWCTA